MGGEELYKVTAVTEDTGKPAEEEASTAGCREPEACDSRSF